ncbi:MAG: sel1 repeat family protein [Alphaproteobacteria bacterium]|nr:sel1 repeat family protein [Alphaproteobacteria bacterium]
MHPAPNRFSANARLTTKRALIRGAAALLALSAVGCEFLLNRPQPGPPPVLPTAALGQCVRETQLEPQSAIVGKWSGDEAAVFASSIERGVDTRILDDVVVMRGPDVLGWTLAVIVKDGCAVARNYLATPDFLHASGMVELYRKNLLWVGLSQAEVMHRLTSLALDGHLDSQFQIAMLYGRGFGPGGDRDDLLSIQWLERAAGRGSVPAQFALGYLYSEGSSNYARALIDRIAAWVWFNLAAEQGDGLTAQEARERHRELSRFLHDDEMIEAARRLSAWRKQP